jgi:hypothetical protein
MLTLVSIPKPLAGAGHREAILLYDINPAF